MTEKKVTAIYYVLMAEDAALLERFAGQIDAVVSAWAQEGGPRGKFGIRQDTEYTAEEAERVRASLRFTYALAHVLHGAEVVTVTPSARQNFEETVNIVRQWVS